MTAIGIGRTSAAGRLYPNDMMQESGHTFSTGVAAEHRLDLGLLRDLERIVHFDAKVANRTLQLGMAKQQLNGPQILRAFVDQRCFRAPHRVRSVRRRIQPGRFGPMMHNPRILACRDVRRLCHSARE